MDNELCKDYKSIAFVCVLCMNLVFRINVKVLYLGIPVSQIILWLLREFNNISLSTTPATDMYESARLT